MNPQAETSFAQREGLLLCMFLALSMNADYRDEKLHAVVRVLQNEPEFAADALGIDDLLTRVSADLHRSPDRILAAIVEQLPTEDSRRRGLALVARIVCAAGVVTENDAALLRRLAEAFGFSPDILEEIALSEQRGLVQFMMVYLVYITATADGTEHPEEFEHMIPLLLSLPAFNGVTTERFSFLAQSAKQHLAAMREKPGLEYLCGTLRRAAELLGDASIPQQALKVVARGIFADGKIDAGEQQLFRTLVKHLGVEPLLGEEMIHQAVAESHDRLRKLNLTENNT